jgi:hypothetical protein
MSKWTTDEIKDYIYLKSDVSSLNSQMRETRNIMWALLEHLNLGAEGPKMVIVRKEAPK